MPSSRSALPTGMKARHLPLLLLAACLVPEFVSAQLAVVNFTQTVYTAPTTALQEELRELQDTVEPFSALRNPVDHTVKVFFEAEGYQADQFPCTFSRELEFEGAAALNRTKGQLHQVGHTKRRFTGYMLVCSDPGPEFKFFTFTTNEMVLKAVAVTAIETREAGVGICLASLYSPRPGFENWVQANLQAGFTDIYVYYTTVKDRAALNPHYGTVQVKGDFVPEKMPDVQYFYFQAPARTWTFAQSTMYTECIHRNRLKHRFLAIIDADEFFWRPPANVSLQAHFASLFPRDAASLVFSDIMYPEPCQDERSFAKGVNPLAASHFYYPTREGTQPKSVVMPLRSLIHRVHTLADPEPGFRCCQAMLPAQGYWKHIRQRGGGCSQHDRHNLFDDRDAASFQGVMQNASLWGAS